MGAVQLRSCACFIRAKKIAIFRNQASDTGSKTHPTPINMRQCDYDDYDDEDDDDLYDYMTRQY